MSTGLTICVVNHQGRDVPARHPGSGRRAAAARGRDRAGRQRVDRWQHRLCPGAFPGHSDHRARRRIVAPGRRARRGCAPPAPIWWALSTTTLRPSPTVFALLAEALASCPHAALAMPRVVHADRPGTIQFEGARAHFIGLMALEGAERPVDGPAPPPRPISSIITACFLVDRRRWGDLRLQDPSFFMYHEDHDLGLRAGQLGHVILSVPRAVCRHGKGTPGLSLRTGQGYSARRVVLMIANRWRILLTRYELRTLLLLAPALVTFELTQLAGSIAKGWFRELGCGRRLHRARPAGDPARASGLGGAAPPWRRTDPRRRRPALQPAAAAQPHGACRGADGVGGGLAQLAPRAPAPARPGLSAVPGYRPWVVLR